MGINEERLARAIRESRIPSSRRRHEVDFTIWISLPICVLPRRQPLPKWGQPVRKSLSILSSRRQKTFAIDRPSPARSCAHVQTSRLAGIYRISNSIDDFKCDIGDLLSRAKDAVTETIRRGTTGFMDSTPHQASAACIEAGKARTERLCWTRNRKIPLADVAEESRKTWLGMRSLDVLSPLSVMDRGIRSRKRTGEIVRDSRSRWLVEN